MSKAAEQTANLVREVFMKVLPKNAEKITGGNSLELALSWQIVACTFRVQAWPHAECAAY
jgi:hypothetical protein